MRPIHWLLQIVLVSMVLFTASDASTQEETNGKKARKSSNEERASSLITERQKLTQRLQEIDDELMELDFPAWTLDPKAIKIPEIPVIGRVHGRPFKLGSAKFSSITLELKDSATRISIHHGIKAGRSLSGMTIEPGGTNSARGIFIHTPDGSTIGSGARHLLRIEFGTEKDGELPAKIYLSTSDRSVIAGTFTLRFE